MVAIRFKGEKGQALMGAQSFLMDFKIALGLDIKNDQIGNYANGEPDGIYGKGTRSAFSQLVRLAQKKAGVDTSDDSLSPENLKHVEAYLKTIPSNSGNDARVAKFLTDLATVNETDGKNPSLLASAHDRVGRATKEWHVDTAALTLPTFGKNRVAQPVAPTQPGELTRKVNHAAAGGDIVKAVYNPDTHVEITVKGADIAQINAKQHKSDRDKAILAAYDAPHKALLQRLNYDAVNQQLEAVKAAERAPNLGRAEIVKSLDAARVVLAQRDDELKAKPVQVIINGERHTITIAEKLKELDDAKPTFGSESAENKRVREIVIAKYEEMKASGPYKEQKDMVDKLANQSINYVPDLARRKKALEEQLAEIRTSVATTPVKIGIPKELEPKTLLASAAPGEHPPAGGVRGRVTNALPT